jgi:hypothetical protein
MTNIAYFSVDIEADGPQPGDYSMSSFGAVLCGTLTQDCFQPTNLDDIANQYYVELKPISTKWVPEAAAVSGLDRDNLINYGLAPIYAMTRFNHFVEDRSKLYDARPIFVGWPLSYDWMWIYWYLMKYAGESAFGFSGAIDMKTWVAAKSNNNKKLSGKRAVYKALGVAPRPHTHNALDDAIEQGELWQHLINWDGK